MFNGPVLDIQNVNWCYIPSKEELYSRFRGILNENNECIKEINDFLMISLPDGSIGLSLFEDRRDFLKGNVLHFIMFKRSKQRCYLKG